MRQRRVGPGFWAAWVAAASLAAPGCGMSGADGQAPAAVATMAEGEPAGGWGEGRAEGEASEAALGMPTAEPKAAASPVTATPPADLAQLMPSGGEAAGAEHGYWGGRAAPPGSGAAAEPPPPPAVLRHSWDAKARPKQADRRGKQDAAQARAARNIDARRSRDATTDVTTDATTKDQPTSELIVRGEVAVDRGLLDRKVGGEGRSASRVKPAERGPAAGLGGSELAEGMDEDVAHAFEEDGESDEPWGDVDTAEDAPEPEEAPRSRPGDLGRLSELGRAEAGGGMGVGHFEALLEHAQEQERTAPPSRERYSEPATFWPRTGYFSNTYLGGDVAFAERQRVLSEALAAHGLGPLRTDARLEPDAFDAPDGSGLSVTATLSERWAGEPQRVFLQVGLQGSRRHGWRRPPLDIVLVVDPALMDGGDDATLMDVAQELLRGLGPMDRLALLVAGADAPLQPLEPVSDVRSRLASKLDAALSAPTRPASDVGGAITRAQGLLHTAAEGKTRLPGSGVVVVLAPAVASPWAVERAAHAADMATLAGVTTSVLAVHDGGQARQAGAWWSVADAGHGGLHGVDASDGEAGGAAVQRELGDLARVVARLVRVNVTLADHVQAVRVVGATLLSEEQKQVVKAREVATDRQISATMGVTADRGDDDDGLQTVIPTFYGGDSHVILLEVWVTGPGAVADVSVRYKDMVALGNATARTSVSLAATPRPDTWAQHTVRAHLAALELADTLEAVAVECLSDRTALSRELRHARVLARRAGDPRAARVIDGLAGLAGQLHRADATRVGRAEVAEAFQLAAMRLRGGGAADR